MKACIYQKQEPVNIPQIETPTLKRRARVALGLRDLLAAHALNPLNSRGPCLCPDGRKVLVAGMGPAGSPWPHYLMNERPRRRRLSTD